jgi:hypothetical protein
MGGVLACFPFVGWRSVDPCVLIWTLYDLDAQPAYNSKQGGCHTLHITRDSCQDQ